MTSIGERLKSERERLGLSQTALADFAGVTKKTQIEHELDRTPPKATYLAQVAQLGVDVSYVVNGERVENAATTPTELAYLRKCRELYELGGNASVDDGLRGLSFLVETKKPVEAKKTAE
jgi:transcriptional regulator with XRE-family HTH domain